jgi:hypothetical protein
MLQILEILKIFLFFLKRLKKPEFILQREVVSVSHHKLEFSLFADETAVEIPIAKHRLAKLPCLLVFLTPMPFPNSLPKTAVFLPKPIANNKLK